MSNLSDKELDRLSREAADSYEPDTSSLSWSRLEQKLSQQMPERPPDGFRFGRINPYVWGPAVALLAGVSFFFIKNNSYSKDSTLKTQSVNQTVPSLSGDNQPANGNTVHLDSISAAAALNADGSNLKPAATGQIPSERSDGGLASVSAGRRSKAMVAGSILAAGSLNAGTSNSGVNSKNIHANERDDITGTENTAGTAYPATAQRTKNALTLPAIIHTGKSPGTITGNDSIMNLLAQSKKTASNKSLRLNRSLNFGLSFGPDYIDGGGITNNQIGNNIGITVGYYLTSKLSVNTGIFYSNKFYWAHGHGYNHPLPVNTYASTFAAPPPVDYVNGSCNMWEIPLTIRYDFAHNEKTRFFANAGLSSYFMMKQNYIYFVHTSQQRLAAWKTSDNQQVNYWFGVADISLGFETEVGKGVSFQAEPFVKLPLRNMGVENLKLNSYGFLLSFKYTPVLSRSRK